MSESFDRLVALFHETGQAHHAAYAETDGDDPDWPIWYAGFLVDRLPEILNNEITRSELVYSLVLLSRQQSQLADKTEWPEYYARYFIENYQRP
jgi:hypothetical protein